MYVYDYLCLIRFVRVLTHHLNVCFAHICTYISAWINKENYYVCKRKCLHKACMQAKKVDSKGKITHKMRHNF